MSFVRVRIAGQWSAPAKRGQWLLREWEKRDGFVSRIGIS
jgi:hypothetical protein